MGARIDGTGDIDVVLGFLRDHPLQAYSIDELRRVNELPQIYASQHKIKAETEDEVIAERLVERYFRSTLKLLVYVDRLERRHFESVAYHRMV